MDLMTHPDVTLISAALTDVRCLCHLEILLFRYTKGCICRIKVSQKDSYHFEKMYWLSCVLELFNGMNPHTLTLTQCC